MALEVNKHVERLASYQPFDANSSQLIQENVDDASTRDVLGTVAFDFVRGLLADPATHVVVLTGDAGHGKTHLCFRLLQSVGIPTAEIGTLLRERCDGTHDLARTESNNNLRIIKDLSEFATAAGAKLTEALSAPGRTTVVCANEGKLRSAIQEGGPDLDQIRRTLEDGVATGRTTLDGRLHVVNLNFQSVTGRGASSLTSQLLRSWAQDQRKWRICAQCDARTICPIRENHRQLADPPLGPERRSGVEALMRLAEQTGHVVTIRELLVVVALAITGSLRCAEVHRRYTRGHESVDWQHEHVFHQAIFGESLSSKQRHQVRLIGALRRLDPGRSALRAVDDFLVANESAEVGHFLPPEAAAVEKTPRTRVQSRRDADRQRRAMVFLRRRDFFNADADTSTPTHGQRAGFRFADVFTQVTSGSATEAELVALRDGILGGLEALQGIRRARHANFLLVDPAFTSHRSRASIVARQIAGSQVQLIPQRDWWSRLTNSEPSVPQSVDWTDRSIFVVFDAAAAERVAIELDLLRFEVVLRYGDGLSARQHFHADIRRISSRLAQLATEGTTEAEITVLVDGERRRLAIDVGDRIRSAEA